MNKHLDSFTHQFYQYDNLTGCGIPAVTARYMAEHGLPQLQEPYWFDCIRFFDEEEILGSEQINEMTAIGLLYEMHYIVVGEDGLYLVDDEDLEQNGKISCGFTNSSLELFVEFISIYCWYIDRYDEKLEADDEETARMVVGELEKIFRSLDERALEDENSFWSVRIEEISYIYI